MRHRVAPEWDPDEHLALSIRTNPPERFVLPLNEDIANAVALGQWQAVEQAPGVGRKLAQRITAELKDKAPGLPVMVPGSGGEPSASAPIMGNAAAEAISALSNLGYQPAQASAAVSAAMKELGTDAETAALIRGGLKELAR